MLKNQAYFHFKHRRTVVYLKDGCFGPGAVSARAVSLLQGAQSVADLKKEVRVVGEALKFNNSRMLGLERLAGAQFKSKTVEVDKIQDIEGKVDSLHGALCKLVAVVGQLVDVEKDGQAKAPAGSGGKDYVA